MKTNETNKAYANGALDGYRVGVYKNPYEEAEQHQAYKEGYDYGVFVYTQEQDDAEDA
jgi:hypothetical protein